MSIRSLTVLSVLALTSCTTIRSAHETQDALAAKGRDDAAASAQSRVDFRGASLASLVDFALTNRPAVVSKALAVRDARLALLSLIHI